MDIHRILLFSATCPSTARCGTPMFFPLSVQATRRPGSDRLSHWLHDTVNGVERHQPSSSFVDRSLDSGGQPEPQIMEQKQVARVETLNLKALNCSSPGPLSLSSSVFNTYLYHYLPPTSPIQPQCSSRLLSSPPSSPPWPWLPLPVPLSSPWARPPPASSP